MNHDQRPNHRIDISEVFRDGRAIHAAVERAVARAVREAEAELGPGWDDESEANGETPITRMGEIGTSPHLEHEMDITRVSLNTVKLFSGVLQVLGCAPGASPLFAAIGGTIGLGAEAAEFVREYNQRKGRETLRKLDRLAVSLDERLRGVEYQVTDEKQDFFVEILKRCVEDDEVEKLAFYEAVLAWIAKDSPRAAAVRIVGDAVRALSYVELWAFALDGKSTAIRDVLQAEGVTEDVWIARLIQFGLIQQGVRVPGRPQKLGAILLRELDAGSLTPPNAVATRSLA